MIVTNHKAFSEWADLLGDEVLAAATLGRLLHHAIAAEQDDLPLVLYLARGSRARYCQAVTPAAYLLPTGRLPGHLLHLA